MLWGEGGGFPRRREGENRWREGTGLEAPLRPVGGGVRELGDFRGRGKKDCGRLRPQGHLWTCVWDLGSRCGAVEWGCGWAPNVSNRLGGWGLLKKTTNKRH